jgi:hypothetical protein
MMQVRAMGVTTCKAADAATCQTTSAPTALLFVSACDIRERAVGDAVVVGCVARNARAIKTQRLIGHQQAAKPQPVMKGNP